MGAGSHGFREGGVSHIIRDMDAATSTIDTILPTPASTPSRAHGSERCSEDRKDSSLPISGASGGYDYDFIDSPSDELTCAICLSVLRDPNLTSCCGNHFCRTCITQIKNEGNPCPLCQDGDYTIMLNKSLVRKVNELKVRCPNSQLGCDWVGELKEAQHHVDIERDDCDFVEVLCDYDCGEEIKRCSLAEHKTSACPARPHTCEHCGLKGKWESITNTHMVVCESYPMECPNKCGAGEIQRKYLDKHVKEVCPLELVACEYSFAGCHVRIHRKDLSKHLSESMPSHLSLLAVLCLECKEKLSEKNVEIAELKSRMEHQERMKSSEIAELKSRLEQQENVIAKLNTEMDDTVERSDMDQLSVKFAVLESTLDSQKVAVSELERSIPKQYPPVDLVMKNFDTHRLKEDQWFSEPFYTHPGGYKMCLSVFACGIGKGKDTDVSVFANLMRGEYDDYLNWPFRGKVVVQLMVEHVEYEEMLRFHSRSPARACNRVTVGERHEFGQGCSEFISIATVMYADAKCLCFKVTSVVCDS